MTSGTAAGGGTYFEDSEDEASDMEEEEDSEDVVTAGSRRGGEVDDSQEMMSGSDSEGVMTPAMPANRSLNASLTVSKSYYLFYAKHDKRLIVYVWFVT